MAVEIFQNEEFSFVYQKSMIPASKEILNRVFAYVKEKKGLPLTRAVDVGCGTGRYTEALAPHFQKVLGIDISPSQINVAQQTSSAKNVSYMVASAEQIPAEDGSVDLVHAGLAAHFFNVEEFVQEAVRVTNKNGCLAFHAFTKEIGLEYKDLSQDLTAIMIEVIATLEMYADKRPLDLMLRQYEPIYEAVPLKDKKWITNIPVKVALKLSDLLGFIRSIYTFQKLQKRDPEGAAEFLLKSEQRLRCILGENADHAVLNIVFRYYCVLACKNSDDVL